MMSGSGGELVRYPFWVRIEEKYDTSEHVLSSLAFDVPLAESGLLQRFGKAGLKARILALN
jgi:hypothetical protein